MKYVKKRIIVTNLHGNFLLLIMLNKTLCNSSNVTLSTDFGCRIGNNERKTSLATTENLFMLRSLIAQLKMSKKEVTNLEQP